MWKVNKTLFVPFVYQVFNIKDQEATLKWQCNKPAGTPAQWTNTNLLAYYARITVVTIMSIIIFPQVCIIKDDKSKLSTIYKINKTSFPLIYSFEQKCTKDHF